MLHAKFSRFASLTAAAFALAAGCAKSDRPATDSAAATPPADSAMGGMGGMAGMTRPPAKDADQEFLRMMSDHHEGMVQMGMAAMTKGSTPAVQGEAHAMHTKQVAEQKQMADMLQARYGDSTMPMLMPSNKSMMESMQGKSGAEYDRAFYESVIAHHGEAIKMVDDMMPKLVNADVKKMAATMKADQTREIAELKKKIK